MRMFGRMEYRHCTFSRELLRLSIITCICGQLGSWEIQCITGTHSGCRLNLQENDKFMNFQNDGKLDVWMNRFQLLLPKDNFTVQVLNCF